MDIITLLLANGFFLSFLLLILLVILAASTSPKKPQRAKIKEDIQKIKKQVEED